MVISMTGTTELEAGGARLRQELKQWERDFAHSNNGRHPSREDIKQNAAIAAKYKRYNKTRAALPTNRPITKDGRSIYEKSPRKPTPVASTPKKAVASAHNTSDLLERDQENTTPIKGPAFVGPTPQKDGRVLGLFDCLSEDQRPATVPSPFRHSPLRTLEPNTLALTPRKAPATCKDPTAACIKNTPITANKHSRTPQSLGKRYLLDTFITPSKRQRLDTQDTPCSTRFHADPDTPAFLRRHRNSLSAIQEHGDTNEPGFVKGDSEPSHQPLKKRRTLTRSLSSMIADLRKAETSRLDEDMDLLRELEDETIPPIQQAPARRTNKAPSDTKPSLPQVAVEDIQKLGPDGTNAEEESDEGGTAGLGRDGKPLKVWKKKGLKRQTRRAHMKPRAPLKRVDEASTGDAGSEAEEEEEEETADCAKDVIGVAEEQMPWEEDPDDEADGEYNEKDTENEGEGDEADEPESKSTTERPTNEQHPSIFSEPSKETKRSNMVQKVVKKISATAHANFRALKIKSSKGAKGGVSKGRFGGRNRGGRR